MRRSINGKEDRNSRVKIEKEIREKERKIEVLKWRVNGGNYWGRRGRYCDWKKKARKRQTKREKWKRLKGMKN